MQVTFTRTKNDKVLLIIIVILILIAMFLFYCSLVKKAEKKTKNTDSKESITMVQPLPDSIVSQKQNKLNAYNIFMDNEKTLVVPCTEIRLTVFEYDSCEYILCGQGIVHKHNCKYCAARAGK